jgi:hypothetical protein
MEMNAGNGLELDGATRQNARHGLKAVGDWATRNQGRHHWPFWSADTGRFT